MKKAKFIINLISGDNSVLNQIESIIGCLVLNQIVNHVDVVYTHKENDAMNEAKKMLPGEYDFVVSVGGDGTLHDVVNGVLAGKNKTPIAVFGSGTANSFVKTLGLPVEKTAFCRMIKGFKTLPTDVGRIDERYFINAAAGGVMMSAMYKTSSANKAVFGRAAYMIEGAKVLPKQMFKSSKLEIIADNFYKQGDVSLFVVKNAGNATGNKDVDIAGTMTDGLLDVLIVEKMNVFRLPGLFLKFMQGEHLNESGISYFQTRFIDIKNLENDSMTVDFDKEKFGQLPVHIEAVPKAVKIIIPERAEPK